MTLKQKIRLRLDKYFTIYYRCRKKSTYRKWLRTVLRDATDHDSIEKNKELLQTLKRAYVTRIMNETYADTTDTELKQCVDYVNQHGLHMYCYEEAYQATYTANDIRFDEEKGLFHAQWKGKKMYMKRSMNTVEGVLDYLNRNAWEQNKNSPHCYLTDTFRVTQGGTVMDIGSAEGNFALEVIDTAGKLYLFECDPEWLEALAYTFADYKDKVIIIPKFVSDKDTEHTVTIDAFMKQEKLEQVNILKMDIEGCEIKALKGAKDTICIQAICKWAVCVYHNSKDKENISKLLQKYRKTYTKGYIMSAIWQETNLRLPFFVKGVLRAEVEVENGD